VGECVCLPGIKLDLPLQQDRMRGEREFIFGPLSLSWTLPRAPPGTGRSVCCYAVAAPEPRCLFGSMGHVLFRKLLAPSTGQR